MLPELRQAEWASEFQKALGSSSSLRSAFLLPSPLLHLADSFPAQPKKPPKIRERPSSPIWILSAQRQRDVLACLPRGGGATTDGPPSANKKKQYDIRDILVTGWFGKFMVRAMVSRVYTLTLKPHNAASWSSHIAERDMTRTSRTVDPR